MMGSRKNSNPVNLQSSNSFKTLLESKNKTPPRLGSMALTMNKNQASNGSLRSSLCNNIIGGLGHNFNSEKKMIESRSNERVSGIKSPQKSMIPLCKNEDGNKVPFLKSIILGEVQSSRR